MLMIWQLLVCTSSVYIMNLPKDIYDQHTQPMLSHINVGFGKDLTIKELAEAICQVVGYKGNIIFDTCKPDGVPRKLLDSGRLNALGWEPKVSLQQGLVKAYADFLNYNPLCA